MKKKSIRDIDVTGKTVLVRADFNVPLENGVISDDTRIQATLPTVEHLLDAGAAIILMSHLGRPSGEGAEPAFTLRPVAEHLAALLDRPVAMAADCRGSEVARQAAALAPGEILMLENTRFYAEETGAVKTDGLDPDSLAAAKTEMKERQRMMARELASLADIYVNDAFGTAQRAHASTSVVAQYCDAAVAGLLMEKELNYLGAALENPERPFVAIIGGAKVSGKLEVLLSLLGKVDSLLIGGGMAYTFKKALGYEVGESICEDELVPTALSIIEKAKDSGCTLLIPSDNVIADRFDAGAETRIAEGDFPESWMGMDIGPRTIEAFTAVISGAHTIVWNGPMGVFEMEPFAKGTMAVCQAVADADAVSIIGGGDSVSAVNQSGLQEKMTHISTGGGASLKFLEGEPLPGVVALDDG